MRGREAPVVEHEPGALPSRASLDGADEQNVIPHAVLHVVATFEPRNATCNQRRPRGAQPIHHVNEAIGMRPGKSAGEVHLIVREHVDRVALGALEGGEASRAAIKAPHDERWVERHGVEGVCGEADESSIGSARANHRYPGSELRERIAKLPVRECGGAAGVFIVGGMSQCTGASKGTMVAARGRMANREYAWRAVKLRCQLPPFLLN